MVKTSTLAVACAGLVVVWTAASFAEIQLASPADGRAMLDRAIAALKADQASALKAFNDERCRDAACWRSSLCPIPSRLGRELIKLAATVF
jgi:predicted benzoate:H+ symporter BenE